MIRKRYNIIYADPPWGYEQKLNVASHGKELEDHYPTMEIEELKALPVKGLANKDCLLFLWVVYPHLENAFELIRAC